jgi:hypothetical protein
MDNVEEKIKKWYREKVVDLFKIKWQESMFPMLKKLGEEKYYPFLLPYFPLDIANIIRDYYICDIDMDYTIDDRKNGYNVENFFHFSEKVKDDEELIRSLTRRNAFLKFINILQHPKNIDRVAEYSIIFQLPVNNIIAQPNLFDSLAQIRNGLVEFASSGGFEQFKEDDEKSIINISLEFFSSDIFLGFFKAMMEKLILLLTQEKESEFLNSIEKLANKLSSFVKDPSLAFNEFSNQLMNYQQSLKNVEL